MSHLDAYTPGPATDVEVHKDAENWTLVLVCKLRHPPQKVWQALTDPASLREWAPFDADGSLAEAGATVKLTTVGAPKPHVTGWQRLNAEYAKQFGVELPGWK